MGYSIIVLVASVALVLWFAVFSDAGLLSKAAALALFALGLICFFLVPRWALGGVFLLLAVSIWISLYRAWQSAGLFGK